MTAQLMSVHPAHDTKWAKALGITKFVSTFTTCHNPGEPRVHNIHLAAGILNNTVVRRGRSSPSTTSSVRAHPRRDT